MPTAYTIRFDDDREHAMTPREIREEAQSIGELAALPRTRDAIQILNANGIHVQPVRSN